MTDGARLPTGRSGRRLGRARDARRNLSLARLYALRAGVFHQQNRVAKWSLDRCREEGVPGPGVAEARDGMAASPSPEATSCLPKTAATDPISAVGTKRDFDQERSVTHSGPA